MKEELINVTLSEERSLLKEWKQLCHTDLPKLHEALKLVRLSVNEYLTQLICKSKTSISSNSVEPTEESEVEDIKDDISGFIKHVNNIYKTHTQHEKRKINFEDRSKKIKK